MTVHLCDIVNVLNFEHLSLCVLKLRSGFHKMLVRRAKREDPDQTVSSEAV